MHLILALTALVGLTLSNSEDVEALENGLARSPPMGWLAWERFTCETDCDQKPEACINKKLFQDMATRLVEDGFYDSGYQYINIDDCWSEKERDPETTRLVPDHKRFDDDGIHELARFVHSKRLKLGLYGDCGLKTCAGYPAQLSGSNGSIKGDYFETDAKTLADWEVDSFKFDGCYIHARQAESICPRFATHLMAQKRPILLVCEWPFYMMYAHAEPDYNLASKSCNVWRYYDDIEDSWASIINTIDYTVKHQYTIVRYHGPGRWFDPDQLVIGNFGLSWAQQRAQMALWAIWAAPLYMSNDLRDLHPEAAKILKNKHLIAVNQDKLGVFGLMVKQWADQATSPLYQAFIKPIEPVVDGCPSFAIVYLNRRTLGNKAKVSFKLVDLLTKAPIATAWNRQEEVARFEGISGRIENQIQPVACRKRLEQATFELFDLFDDRKSLGTLDSQKDLSLEVEPSGVRVVLLLKKQET